MSCIAPIMLRVAGKFQPVPCGKCGHCLSAKRFQWTFRLNQELKVADSALFLTLTYDEQNVPLGKDDMQCLHKPDYQSFMKRLRHLPTTKPLRYYAVGEYGGETLRPHYHAIMFNLPYEMCQPYIEFYREHKVACFASDLSEIWKKGFVSAGSVTPASIHYVTKYVIGPQVDLQGRTKPFALISNRSGGIGKDYVDKHINYHRGGELRNYVMYNGYKFAVPRYYRKKLFTDRELEQMAASSIVEGDERWRAEIERLGEFAENPYNYYDERREAASQSVLKSAKK